MEPPSCLNRVPATRGGPRWSTLSRTPGQSSRCRRLHQDGCRLLLRAKWHLLHPHHKPHPRHAQHPRRRWKRSKRLQSEPARGPLLVAGPPRPSDPGWNRRRTPVITTRQCSAIWTLTRGITANESTPVGSRRRAWPWADGLAWRAGQSPGGCCGSCCSRSTFSPQRSVSSISSAARVRPPLGNNSLAR